MHLEPHSLLAAACLFLVASLTVHAEPATMPPQKLTPILFVDTIEDCLPFWVDRLGFQKTMEVPDGDHLVFVGLAAGSTELMLQTWASLQAEQPAIFESTGKAASFLYLEVEDVDATARAVEDSELLVPKYETFYGALEFVVRSPGGHLVTFAQHGKGAEEEGQE